MEDLIEASRLWGEDRLLVQGVGGNVSWKDADTLWIKASGTSLRDASPEIFVPVSLSTVTAGGPAIPLVPSGHRPSIEVEMHAVIPQRVVVHLHAVDALAALVRVDWDKEVRRLLPDDGRCALIDYVRPGAPLAQRVRDAVEAMAGGVTTFILRNHGIVIAGESVPEVSARLDQVLAAFRHEATTTPLERRSVVTAPSGDYAPIADGLCDRLMVDERLRRLTTECWALYPDHVVFLGPEPFVIEGCHELDQLSPEKVPLVFVSEHGVMGSKNVTSLQREQLMCFLDVLERLPQGAEVSPLPPDEVAALLSWDAEKHRQGLARG